MAYMLLFFALLNCDSLQAADTKSVMLRYTLEQLEATGPDITTAPEQPATTSRQQDGKEALEQLLKIAGKKERKIIERILNVGSETGIIKVEQLKQKLGRINVSAVVELYRDVRTLKLAKLDATRIEKIQATLAKIDASLAKNALTGRQIGDIAFFAALARDRLAAKANDRSEKDRLRREAVVNYQQTVDQLSD